MRRFDFDYDGMDSERREVIEREHGDYVLHEDHVRALATAERERDEARAEVERLRAELNTPELHDFAAGVVREAAHQRARWGSEHDAGKAPADWFWLLGYLGGKALAAALAGNTEKALHHCVSSAAALANWHAALSGQHTDMRPGIDAPEEGGDHG